MKLLWDEMLASKAAIETSIAYGVFEAALLREDSVREEH